MKESQLCFNIQIEAKICLGSSILIIYSESSIDSSCNHQLALTFDTFMYLYASVRSSQSVLCTAEQSSRCWEVQG
jgi:hypothetical protein